MRGQLLALCSVLLASHPAACAAEKLLAMSGPEAMNKAVLAYYDPPSKAHLHILGRKALLYKDARSLETHFRAFSRARSSSMSWDVYTQQYNPKAVMRRFCHIFK